MENSGKILLDDDKAQWYVALGDRWIGPLASADIYEKIVQQEISSAHYVWKPGQSEWKRICDTKSFQTVVPGAPQKKFQNEVKEAAKPIVKQVTKSRVSLHKPETAPDSSLWFLFYNGSQFGPFSGEEVKKALASGKITENIFGWTDGMADWKKIKEIPTFKGEKTYSGPKPPPAPPSEQRKAPRRPLVAKILMASGEKLHVGVCRDISVGGIQILTDRAPGPIGTRVKVNVSADGLIQPFVAEGVVVRILEDGRGFSFRFEKLADSSRQAVESYIHAAGA